MKPITVYDTYGNECIAYVPDPNYQPAFDTARWLWRAYCNVCLVAFLAFIAFVVFG